MSVFPGDVVSTSVGVLHVGSVIVERSRAGDSFAVSGVTGDGVVHSNIPIGEGMVPLGVDVSDAEALVWFDRERRLRRLGDAVFSPGDGVRALGRLMEGQVAGLSLSDCESVDTVLGYLKEAEGELVEASAWVAEKRMECLRAFEGFHAGWLKYRNRRWVEPELGEYCKWAGVKLEVGGIYQFERKYEGHGYFKVVDNKLKTGIVLYGGSGGVGDREWSEYEGVSVPGALRDIFLDMFAAGDGKPKCLPAREELDGNRYCWADNYAKCRDRMLDVTANMLFDIEKSVGYVRWLREQLVGFYRELGFTI